MSLSIKDRNEVLDDIEDDLIDMHRKSLDKFDPDDFCSCGLQFNYLGYCPQCDFPD